MGSGVRGSWGGGVGRGEVRPPCCRNMHAYVMRAGVQLQGAALRHAAACTRALAFVDVR